jgi:YegS/Rv2252/BmrU family lipid kinase
MRHGLILYNPAAGRIRVDRFVGITIRSLASAGWRIEAAATLSGTHTLHAARQAAQDGYDAVFAIGGDGTVGQVAGGLMDSETALAVLPAGTANVWALEQGLKPFTWLRWWTLRENAQLVAEMPAQRVDVGLCNDHPFLLWSGIGLDAQTIQRLEPRTRLSKYLAVPHYFATTLWEATFWHGMDLRVWADEKEVEGHFLLAVATNVRHYAGGMAVISPHASLDDGEMDLWLMSGNSLADAFRHFFDLLAGRHLSSDQARCLPFRSARVESSTPFSVQLDGEPLLGSNRAEIVVRPRALKVLMPERALALLQSPALRQPAEA